MTTKCKRLSSRQHIRMQKVYNTRYFRGVSSLSTARDLCCLTSEIGREPVYSAWYGRRQRTSSFNLFKGKQWVKHCAICYTKDGIKEKGGAGPGRGGRELIKRWRREGRTELEVDNKLLLEGKSHHNLVILFFAPCLSSRKSGSYFLCGNLTREEEEEEKKGEKYKHI